MDYDKLFNNSCFWCVVALTVIVVSNTIRILIRGYGPPDLED
jgi:hypothetical protein